MNIWKENLKKKMDPEIHEARIWRRNFENIASVNLQMKFSQGQI